MSIRRGKSKDKKDNCWETPQASENQTKKQCHVEKFMERLLGQPFKG